MSSTASAPKKRRRVEPVVVSATDSSPPWPPFLENFTSNDHAKLIERFPAQESFEPNLKFESFFSEDELTTLRTRQDENLGGHPWFPMNVVDNALEYLNQNELLNIRLVRNLSVTHDRFDVLLSETWEKLMQESSTGFSKAKVLLEYLKNVTGRRGVACNNEAWHLVYVASGAESQAFHQDYAHLTDDDCYLSVIFPLVAEDRSGGTRFGDRGNRSSFYDFNFEGGAVVFHGKVWHHGLANDSGSERVFLLASLYRKEDSNSSETIIFANAKRQVENHLGSIREDDYLKVLEEGL